MNKDRMIGVIDKTAGSARRKAGEFTYNPEKRFECMVQQVKSMVEDAWGKAEDVAKETS